jgi:hypothetical protein
MGKSSKNTSLPKASATITENSKYDAIPDVRKELIAEHLPPIGLVSTVVACSGILFVFAFRDVFATGRIIGGDMDAAYMVRLQGSRKRAFLSRTVALNTPFDVSIP